MNASLYVVFLFGLVECFVVFTFVFEVIDAKVAYKKILFMALCRDLAIIAVRKLMIQNVFSIVLINISIDLLLIWIFTGIKGFRTVTAVVLSFLIIMLVEPVSIVYGGKLLQGLNENLMWIITGLPEVLLLVAFVTLMRKAKQKNANQKQAISQRGIDHR